MGNALEFVDYNFHIHMLDLGIIETMVKDICCIVVFTLLWIVYTLICGPIWLQQ